MEFDFPIPPGHTEIPLWMGNCFRIGSKKISILKYTQCESGWDAQLTELYENASEAGDQYYIDRASRLRVCIELEKVIKNRNVTILEIGSSSGYLLQAIKTSFPGSCLIGSDCVPELLEKIAETTSDVPLIQFDLVDCPLPDKSIDVVIALNVLEHIKDDGSALKQIYRILKPGGYGIIEVPAGQDLYDFFDAQFKHFRRYDIHDLCTMAQESGFMVIHATHLGFFLFPFFSLIKRRNKRKSNPSDTRKKDLVKQQIAFGGKTLHKIFDLLMTFEIWMGKKIKYPFGIRCCVVLQRCENNE